MQIDQLRRVAKPIPLTALVDVAFLLLMFFVLSTTFAKFGIIGLGQQGPASGRGAPASQAEPLPGIIVDVFHGPEVRVNGRTVPLAELARALDVFEARGLDSAIIRVRSDADVQDLVSVLDTARLSRLRTLSVAR